MKRPTPRPQLFVALIAFPVALFVLGTLWSAVNVYLLGNWDAKFGPWGSFQLSVLIFGCYTAFAFVGNGFTILILRQRLWRWSIRRLIGLASVSAVVSIAIASTIGKLIDLNVLFSLLVSLLGYKNAEFAYPALLFAQPCVVIAIAFPLAEIVCRKPSRSNP